MWSGQKAGQAPVTCIKTLIGSALLGIATTVSANLIEPPMLLERVAAGDLPPIEQRLPDKPTRKQFRTGQVEGQHGGTLRILMGGNRDVRMMTVYGYARLLRYNEKFELEPDLLQRIDVIDNRDFTFHLRPGHKWSNGAPFTTEDFRYFWEDVASNRDLSRFGPPKEMLVDGELPQVEITNTTTIRYRWSKPNPYFLPALAAARPLYLYRASHYLKNFHQRYSDPRKLQQEIEQAGVRNWAGLHIRKDHQYYFDNPDLPTLQPWQVTTQPPSERFIFERNPFYHHVDSAGRQLPYIDRIVMHIVSKSLVPAKTGAGEADLQGRYLRLDNYTFLKAGEQRNRYHVHLWQTGVGSQIALYPNLNSNDRVWRDLVRDVRFRRALSMAINREEINKVVYFGLAIEGNNTVLPESPLFRAEYQKKWTRFDLAAANALLDEIGLTRRNNKGLRLMPNGQPLNIIVQSAGEYTEQTDAIELISDSWKKIGIALFVKPSQREVFRNRVLSGEAMMAIWSGVDNGLASADMSPREFAPTSQDQYQWPLWGSHFLTRGKSGEAPDMPLPRQLLQLIREWESATQRQQREAIWHEILTINSEQQYVIGLVSGVGQPIVVSQDLHNVPERGIYAYAPTAYFGIYRPERFWFADNRLEEP